MLQAEQLIERCRAATPLTAVPGGGAADLRSAISRAYYSAFLVARSFLEEIGYSVTMLGRSHEVVAHALRESGERELIRAASDLGTLGTDRRIADYELHKTSVEQVARADEMLRFCKSVISRLDAARTRTRTDPAYKKSIIDSIDAWRNRDGEKGIWKT
jgi:uncharacterized protein (UPF0332 family)